MYEERIDLLVVGAGPGGLSAAVRAAQGGLRVALVDQQPTPGGQIWRSDRGRLPDPAHSWRERAKSAGVRWLPGSAVVDLPAPDRWIVEQPGGALRLRGDALVIATGAYERYLPFPGSTLPGVTAPGGLQALAKGGWPVSGKRILLAGTGPLLLAVADSLLTRGGQVEAIVEQANFGRLVRLAARLVSQPGKLLELRKLRQRLRAVPHLYGAWVSRVDRRSDKLVATVSNGESTREIRVDHVAVGYGLIPDTTLARALGCRIEGARVVVDAWQQTSTPRVYCVGEPTGVGGVEKSLIEGQIAGLAAAGQHAQARSEGLLRAQRRARRFARALADTFRLRPELADIATPESVVCRCEDVRMGEIASSRDAREARLLARCGMGSCQGRVCSGALSFLRGWPYSAPRPPFFPTPIQTLIDTWPSDTTEPTS